MTALFAPPAGALTLDKAELQAITGAGTAKLQTEWLRSNGWQYHVTRAGDPVVGRLYASLKLANVEVSSVVKPGSWSPDFAAANR